MARCNRAYIFCALLAVSSSQAVWAEVPGTTAMFDYGFVHNGGTYTLPVESWVPEDAGTIRGMLFLCPASGTDFRGFINDSTKSVARSLGFGLVGWKDGNFIYQGANAVEATSNLEGLLNTTASMCGRPEVSNCPVAYYGASKGAWVANNFAAQTPSRSIAFLSDKGSSWMSTVSADAKKVPGMFVAGSNDTTVPPGTVWDGYNTWRNGQQANTALTVLWGAVHTTPIDLDFLASNLAEATKERYPAGQVPSATPNNPLVLNDVNPDHVYYANASQPGTGNAMTHDANRLVAPASEFTGTPELASWFSNRNSALVSNAYKYMENGNPLSVTINGMPFESLSFAELGDSVSMEISLVGVRPANIQSITAYLGNNEIDITTDLLNNGSVTLPYTPGESGVHSLIAAMKCLESGTPNIYSNFDVLYVHAVPEPASLVLVITAGLGAVAYVWRRRRS